MYKLNILATNNCNAQVLQATKDSPGVCAFCFRQETDVLTNREKMIQVVRKIKELPFEDIVTVTGGEPLLSRFIVPLVKELQQSGKKVSLHTNGILLENYLEKFDGSVSFISLPYDGNKPEIANYYRGVGYYDIQQRNFNILKDSGIKIGLNTLLTPYNYDIIEEMALELKNYENIWYWFVKIFKRMNMSLKTVANEYELDMDRYIAKVERLRTICPHIDIYPSNKVKQRKPIFIDLSGDVFIFNDATQKNTFAGNILCDDFRLIESFLTLHGGEK